MKDNQWYLIDPPKPKDECFYDIELEDGSIIKNVEFWACGGVFLQSKKEISEKIISEKVIRFRQSP